MHTLLIGINLQNNRPALWSQWTSVIGKTIPSLDIPAVSQWQLIPEIGGGWATFQPAEERTPSFISDYQDNDIIVIAIGDYYHARQSTVANHIAQVWRKNGINAVRLLDGCFAAVIVDRVEQTVFLVNDLTGRLALRYLADGPSLLISTHDLPLVATGRCPLTLDLCSAYSSLLFDWSLSGNSFLQAIKVGQGDSYVKWQNGKTDRIYNPLLDLSVRISAKDKEGIQTQIDKIMAHMRNVTYEFCKGAENVEIDLTAGLDSRTILAILYSIGYPREKIKSSTIGDENSGDVQTAQYIAKKYRFSHRCLSSSQPDQEEFLQHLDLLAYSMNGATNGQRAVVNPLPQNNLNQSPHLYGGGGEIYRGYVYPSQPNRQFAAWRIPEIACYLTEKFVGRRRQIAVNEELAPLLYERLRHSVAGYCAQSSHVADVLDLFYLHERFAHWGALSVRGSWWSHYFTPFGSPTAIRLAFQLPAPIGTKQWLHHTFIKRYLGKAYYWPLINHETSLPLSQFSTTQQWLIHPLQQKYFWVNRKLTQRNPFLRKKNRNLSQIQTESFTTAFRDIAADILLTPDGITSQIVGREVAEQIVQNHMGARKSNGQVIGSLLTLERWYTQIKKTAHLAH